MATSPPTSPNGAGGSGIARPRSAMIRPTSTRPRSTSRMSITSKPGVGAASTRSDEEGKHTAVRVAVRVRPPLRSTDPGYELVPQRFRGSTCNVTSPTSLTVESNQGKKLFVFDRVFGEEIDQEGVWEYLQESVNSFVQGYNVSLLAYGQSGAGKSYTMGTTGPNEQNDARIMGVVPRAAAALFEKLSPTAKSGIRSPNRYSMNGPAAFAALSKGAEKNWKMTATYVEIYQEQLRDLLVDESIPVAERPAVTIREDSKGRILLTGLRQMTINSIEDLLDALNFGSSIRQTDATAVNARSSRSHAVFSLNLVQKKGQATPPKEKRRSVPLEALSGTENLITVDSKLHFVDLAGSERLKNTQAHGERAKEGISINAGLASLGKVISQLSSRSSGSHVSYRDSRLTRLLQDSLGGNAITYMVACINPAEFHLSETLNTVQYAQRARNIQLKPQIQTIHDDSDKQAVIDRMRAEISFLRDQIRITERTERNGNGHGERNGRSHEREVELQNQFLDIQENYNALSQRHAKLIAEIAKARETNGHSETPLLADAIGNSAVDRLKKSNSFAEAVEEVVLEYERTIQSLEASLTNTRSSLSNTESTLLEKETRIAYMETVVHQLQARLQKSMDRETNDENYLRELEARVAGATSEEDKSSTLVASLKTELARVRESEAGAEDYISTLEERLAEAEQQHEIMAREIERLEHVVERQRSINKLDNLLYELDNIRQTDTQPARINGHSRNQESGSFHSFPDSDGTERDESTRNSSRAAHIRAVDSVGGAVQEPVLEEGEESIDEARTPVALQHPRELRPMDSDEPTSPAQSKFVNDKLESVTQELFDLRVEHESTVTDFEELHRKYQVALSTMAELQDSLEDQRRGNLSRPVSFFKSNEDGQHVPKRSLSTELADIEGSRSVAGDNESVKDDATEVLAEAAESNHVESIKVPQQEDKAVDAALVAEMEKLRELTEEQKRLFTELQDTHSQLKDKHSDTLDYVEELKLEVQKATSAQGRASPNPNQIIRRKADRASILSADRASRSFSSIRTLVADSLEDQPEKLHEFDSNINSAMSEFQMRTERVQQLETELTSLRKEMEAKSAIISGLTRERHSLKASPIDISALSNLERQLTDSESKIRALSDSHNAREKELLEQINSLQSTLLNHSNPDRESQHTTFFESEGSTIGADGSRDSMIPEEHQRKVVELQREVADWRSKHDSAMESMKTSEKQLLATITELQTKAKDAEPDTSRSISPEDMDVEKQQHQRVVSGLQRELEEHKNAAGLNAQRLSELEKSYNNILTQVEEEAKSKELTEKELNAHRSLVTNLEGQLEAHKAAIASHQGALDALKDNHLKELGSAQEEALKAQEASNEKLAAAIAEHKEATLALQTELETARSSNNETKEALEAEVAKSREQIAGIIADASLILNKPTNFDNLTAHIQALVNARKDIGALHETATGELRSAREEIEALRSGTSESDKRLEELKTLNDETMRELELISERELKSSRLVEELEEQLNSNFDQTQAANNRLSALQVERQDQLRAALTAREDVQTELEDARSRITHLEQELESQRRAVRDSQQAHDLQRNGSGAGNDSVRKSVSPVNLPSPPPAIPLPPLPSVPAASGVQQPSPPQSRHQSKDIATTQQLEDQEARIRTIEKHLFAEKQLTATLEEALTDLEASSTKMKSEMEIWRRKCASYEEELAHMRKEKQNTRLSVQQMEDEARRRIDLERAKLEERMQQLNSMSKKQKKKSSINCF